MSDIVNCPTCAAKVVIKTINDETIYKAVQDEDALKKVGQLKKAMQKFKEKAEALEKELAQLKS